MGTVFNNTIKNRTTIFEQPKKLLFSTLDGGRLALYIPRNVGSTNWILKSAILNEEVIIVVKNGACKNDLKSKYEHIRREFYYNMTGTEPPARNMTWPKFVTLNELDTAIRGHRVPIVFDNSCFF